MNSAGKADERTDRASIADKAGRWDARLRAPDCTDADRSRCTEWRNANPAHHAAFEKAQAIVASLRHDRARADIRALRDEAMRAMGTQRRRRMGWAASVLAVGVGIAVWTLTGGDRLRAPLGNLAEQLAGAESYATGIGQRSTFTLADGTSVELNAQTRIVVDYSESLRRVELVRGQALFNVAKYTQRPFIVRAGDRNIVAVGTQFDVRLEGGSVQVTLIEGRVRVEQPEHAKADTASRVDESAVFLAPGQQLRASRGQEARNSGRSGVVRDIDVDKVTGWREGHVFLDDLTLAEAVAEMNRHSQVQIAIGDPRLEQLRVNGMFNAGEQEAFAAALEDYFAIAVEHRGSQEIVLAGRR